MKTFELSKEQQSIANKAIHNVLEKEQQSFITGPAGCGKTTIANEIATRLFEKGMNVFFAAPTHTAANRLSKVLSEGENQISVSTIHAFLKMRLVSTEYGKKKFEMSESTDELFNMKTDILIVDEASMVNDEIYALLTKTCRHRIIFLGDSCQIPAVTENDDSKTRLLTIKDSEPAVKRYVKNVYELTKVYRQNNETSLYRICQFLRNSILDGSCIDLYNNKKKLIREIEKLTKEDDTVYFDIAGKDVVPSLIDIPDTCFIAFGNPTVNIVQQHLPEWYVENGYAILNGSVSKAVLIDGRTRFAMMLPNNAHVRILKIIKENVKKWGVRFDRVSVMEVNGVDMHDILVPSEPDRFQEDQLKWINIAKYNAGISYLTKDEQLLFDALDYKSLDNKSMNLFMVDVTTLREGRASTTHRAQGQQWNNCIIAFNNIMFSGVNMDKTVAYQDDHRKIIAMKLLYTAISRSKEKVVFCFENKKEAYEPLAVA